VGLLLILETADSLYSKKHGVVELYDYLKSHRPTDNAEILWRISRAARDLAKESSVDKSRKKELSYEAFECAKKALEVDDQNFASHKWFAITIADIGDYEGLKSKISNAFLIRKHLERAIEINPNDATTIFCLGMWCYNFANMPGWQHRLASYIFTTPPTSTYTEAANYFSKAERAEPNFYSTNLLMLGTCFLKTGDNKRAMLYLDRAVKYPATTEEDEENKVKAQQLLDELLRKQKK